MKQSKGFTLIEMIIVLVVIGIIAAILVPTYSDLTTESYEQTTQSIASSLTTASARNARFDRMGSSKKIVVDNCTNVPSAFPDGISLPSGYTITSEVISADASVSCTLTAPDGNTEASFVGIGVD